MTLPAPEIVRQLLRYEPETGKLFWRERGPEWFASKRAHSAWNARFSGMEAFTARTSHGYAIGNFLGKLLMAHRVIWVIAQGCWPSADVDHINSDRSDNRIVNLREATRSENNCNRPISSANTSGLKGVTFHAKSRKWRAQIKKHGKNHFLGCFETPQAAHAAYSNAAPVIHGDFARAA